MANITEKIEKINAEIKKSQDKITAEQAKVTKLQKELATLESLEVKEMLKEIDMPIDQLKAFLKNMKANPMAVPQAEAPEEQEDPEDQEDAEPDDDRIAI